jgi:hypothetical protein
MSIEGWTSQMTSYEDEATEVATGSEPSEEHLGFRDPDGDDGESTYSGYGYYDETEEEPEPVEESIRPSRPVVCGAYLCRV